MLPNSVFIDVPSSIGGGQYTLDLYFLQPSLAKYLVPGDYIKDTADNEYSIVSLSNNPHVDGGSITVQFVTTDTSPLQDSDYNSTAFTPGQVDIRPEGVTSVIINNVNIHDAQNYEYLINLDVESTGEADKVIVGDSLVDFNGKDFELTFIDPVNRFTVACRAKEVHKEAISPSLGAGSIYEPTDNINLFQGTPISDPSRTVVRNRDNWIVDAKLKEIEDSISVSGAKIAIEDTFENTTGSTINSFNGVATDPSGDIKVIDVSDESEVLAFKGVTTEAIVNSSTGNVAFSGLIKNVSLGFALQEPLFIAKDGTLTNTPPEIGVNGFVSEDFVIYIGHIAKNKDTPANKDLLLKPQIVGQL